MWISNSSYVTFRFVLCVSFKCQYFKSHFAIFENYGINEYFGYVSSDFLLEKMIGHKIHICKLCGIHELCGYVSLNLMPKKIIYYKFHICYLHWRHLLMCTACTCTGYFFSLEVLKVSKVSFFSRFHDQKVSRHWLIFTPFGAIAHLHHLFWFHERTYTGLNFTKFFLT